MRINDFHRRFANGEQYLELGIYGNELETPKQYYWQSRGVYNRIKPIIEKIKLTYGKIKHFNKYIYGKDGLVARLIPIQRAYNALMNRSQELIHRIGLNNLAVEDGSIDLDNLEEDGLFPGKVLVYRQGAKLPQNLGLVLSPSDVDLIEKERGWLLQEFKNIRSSFEVSLHIIKEREDDAKTLAEIYAEKVKQGYGEEDY